MSLVNLFVAAMNSVWVLENPGSSLIFEYKWVKEMVRLLNSAGVEAGVLMVNRSFWLLVTHQVKKASIWMKNYGHATPKPTCLLANSNLIGRLLRGKLDRSTPTLVRTSRKYVDGAGKTRWQGTAALKGTQCLVLHMGGVGCRAKWYGSGTGFSMPREYPPKYAAAVVGLQPLVASEEPGSWSKVAWSLVAVLQAIEVSSKF